MYVDESQIRDYRVLASSDQAYQDVDGHFKFLLTGITTSSPRQSARRAR